MFSIRFWMAACTLLTALVSVIPAQPLNPNYVDGGAILMPAGEQAALLRKDRLWKKALQLHYNSIVMDGHVDVPSLVASDANYKFTTRHSTPPHVDLPRMFEGGLDAPFFSIYVAADYPEGRESINRAKEELFYLRQALEPLSDQVEFARNVADIHRITRSGKKAILMGIEGGHAIAHANPETMRYFFQEGVRYVTLTHANTNSFADASQSPPKWGGLNDAGRNLVREMNRLGVLVDISHVADSTFWDALEVSKAPMIASHSACRSLTANVRNMTDDMIRALAEKGGVIMINFMEGAVNRQFTQEVMNEVYRRVQTEHNGNLYAMWQVMGQVQVARGLPPGTIDDVVAHILHAVQVAGVDHVGLGSDFDGATMPAGLDDVTRLPFITYKLLKSGLSERDVQKILGGNVLRLLEDAERIAASMP